MTTREITLVRLPEPVAEAIDRGIAGFEMQHKAERLTVNTRWQGAHLWQVIGEARINGDACADSAHEAFVTHRATVAAYSDCPDQLVFTPDALVTRPEGRYIPAPEQRAAEQIRLSIFELMGKLLQGSEDVTNTIRKTLDAVWSKAPQEFSPDSAWVLLP